jgi:DNA-binding NarL/FixJ family response regulator
MGETEMNTITRRRPTPAAGPTELDHTPKPRIATLDVDDTTVAVVSVPLLAPALLSRLTPVEQEVASLAAGGLSNAAIGTRRGTSERTVANQMASILRKLGVGSRYELAARLSRCALDTGES